MESAVTAVSADRGTTASFGRVVVPTALDGRYDRGVAFGTRLAGHWAIPLHLASVEIGSDGSDSVTLDRGAELNQARAAIMAAHPQLEVTDEMVAATDSAVDSLAASLEPTDLVVMATDAGGEGRGESFAQALAHAWGGPILMLGPRTPSDVSLGGDIVVAVDGSALAERVVPLAERLAEKADRHLWVVQVVPSATTAHIERLVARGERVSESAYVIDLTSRIDRTVGASWNVVHDDDAAVGLMSFIDDHEIALLVMATHGASGIPRPAFGSTCMAAVLESPVPVVVVRPTAETLELDLRD